MKQIVYIISILALLISLFGCKGEDGKDGKTTLRYDWVYAPSSISDTNPSTPSTVYQDVSFDTEEGTFQLAYYNYYGLYIGYYTIEADKGEEGKTTALLVVGEDGADGQDRDYEIFLYKYYDPTISYSLMSSLVPDAAINEPQEDSTDNKQFDQELFKRIWSDDSLKTYSEVHAKGNAIITYEYKWVSKQEIDRYKY